MLRERVEDFIANRADLAELYELLNDCVADGTLEALSCVRRLYEADYGGFTFNFELKAPAALTFLIWGQAGIKAMVDGATAQPTSKNMSLAVQLLANIAARTPLPLISFVRDRKLADRIRDSTTAAPDLPNFCRARLVDLALSFESEDDVASHVGMNLAKPGMSEPAAAKELFAALSARWLAVSTPVLERYEALIATEPDNEPAFQRFLTEHPQLLDPMAIQVWPQPNLFGTRYPDFVVRRADNSYLVVEIERPSKPLVTAGGYLSADVTHAEQQTADDRSYLMQRPADTRSHFPNFSDPDCLVVIGLERMLDERQRAVLHDANRRYHRSRIVGFDWLAGRARAVAANITRHHVDILNVRMT